MKSACKVILVLGLGMALGPLFCRCQAAEASAARPEVEKAPSLARSARGLFDIGVGVNDRIAERLQDHPLLKAQFSFLTPENCMKPAQVQGAEGKFNFALPDSFVDFAARNHFKVCGHCLIWAKDDRTPGWFFRDGDAPASREQLLSRMRDHIQAVAGRYRGRVAMWDVVNEALLAQLLPLEAHQLPAAL